jgi:hypothetical protein
MTTEKKEIELKVEASVIKEAEIKHILEPGEVGCVVDWEVKDKDGKITSQGSKKCESFVRQFMELLLVAMQPYSWGLGMVAVANYSIRDTANTLRNIGSTKELFGVNAGAGITTYGPMVGTGVAAPTVNDYALQTSIGHGSGAGQLQYSAVTFGAPASDANVSQFTVTRNFANASGGLITVNEIGMYCMACEVGYTRYFMTLRDVIGGGIAVPNGQTLTLNFRIQASV